MAEAVKPFSSLGQGFILRSLISVKYGVLSGAFFWLSMNYKIGVFLCHWFENFDLFRIHWLVFSKIKLFPLLFLLQKPWKCITSTTSHVAMVSPCFSLYLCSSSTVSLSGLRLHDAPQSQRLRWWSTTRSWWLKHTTMQSKWDGHGQAYGCWYEMGRTVCSFWLPRWI